MEPGNTIRNIAVELRIGTRRRQTGMEAAHGENPCRIALPVRGSRLRHRAATWPVTGLKAEQPTELASELMRPVLMRVIEPTRREQMLMIEPTRREQMRVIKPLERAMQLQSEPPELATPLRIERGMPAIEQETPPIALRTQRQSELEVEQTASAAGMSRAAAAEAAALSAAARVDSTEQAPALPAVGEPQAWVREEAAAVLAEAEDAEDKASLLQEADHLEPRHEFNIYEQKLSWTSLNCGPIRCGVSVRIGRHICPAIISIDEGRFNCPCFCKNF